MVFEAKIAHLLACFFPSIYFQHFGPEIKWVDGSKPLLKVSTHLVSTVYTQVRTVPLEWAVIALWMSLCDCFSKPPTWYVLWIYVYSIELYLKKLGTYRVLICNDKMNSISNISQQFPLAVGGSVKSFFKIYFYFYLFDVFIFIWSVS